MGWWLTPPGKRVFIPDLCGLPKYKKDAFRLFIDGLSVRLLKGTC